MLAGIAQTSGNVSHNEMTFLSNLVELLMGFQDVAFLPSIAIFSTTFLKIVVEVKASEPPHVLKLRLVLSNRILPVYYFCSNKAFLLCQLSLM